MWGESKYGQFDWLCGENPNMDSLIGYVGSIDSPQLEWLCGENPNMDSLIGYVGRIQIWTV
jgi:hypothetical protein